MRRRSFITLLSVAASWPLVARTQQRAMPVIGYLNPFPPDLGRMKDDFRDGLKDAGYIEHHNVVIEYRSANGNFDRLPALAADLVARKVDVILAAGGHESALAAQRATSTIPIVFISVGDPIAAGLVASLARPGGNLTGFTVLSIDLNPKRLELLSELIPQARLIALLVNANAQGFESVIANVQQAAQVKGVQLIIVKVSSAAELDAAFASLSAQHVEGVVVASHPWFTNRRGRLLSLAARYSMPVIYYFRGFTDAGGLISYGPNASPLYRQAGAYVGRVLAGEKPSDLPVQEPSVYELVINLKTAKALGLTVPQSLFARADEVIE